MKQKVIAIHQPNYIPWLGYFYKIYMSDIFVFHDDAGFSESGAHNYHYIKTPQGNFRLKIPVRKDGNRIMEIKTKDETGWKQKHLKTIKFNYSKAKYFDEVYSNFSEVLLEDYNNLAELNIAIVNCFCEKLGIKTQVIKSSSLLLTSSREQKIFDTCKKLDASVYFSGLGAKNYQNEENFRQNGIDLIYSNYQPFSYFQLWGDFEHNVSIIDYLMFNGYDWQKVIDNQKSN